MSFDSNVSLFIFGQMTCALRKWGIEINHYYRIGRNVWLMVQWASFEVECDRVWCMCWELQCLLISWSEWSVLSLLIAVGWMCILPNNRMVTPVSFLVPFLISLENVLSCLCLVVGSVSYREREKKGSSFFLFSQLLSFHWELRTLI